MWLASSLLALVTASACDKVPLTAPSGSTVTLFSNTTVVPLNGSAEITATVIESAGTLVQNGTLVTFTTTIGTLDPSEARTHDGKVTVRLVAGSQSGTASIRAFSGGTSSGALELTVGAKAVKTITLTANPGSVSVQNGTTVLTAVVFDENGNPVPGIPVSFTTTAGQLLNTRVTTDNDGIARTSLTTSVQATVQATAGAVQSSTVQIAVNAGPRVSITAPTTSIQAGTQASFSYTITTDTNVGLRNASITWGDGSSSAVSNTSGSIPHTYQSAGTYTIRLTATDANGLTGTNEVQVVVLGSGLVGSVAASPNPTTTTGITTLTVTLASGVQVGSIQSVTFDPGEGEDFIFTNPGLTAPYRYHRTGTFTLRATLNYVDGRKSQPIQATVIVN